MAASWPQVWETAMPKGARREKIAATKMTPRRPRRSLRGSEIQPALFVSVLVGLETVWIASVRTRSRGATYKIQIVM